MSVPVPMRSHGELEVNTKALELCIYTLRVTSNQKTFPIDQLSFTEKIREAAIEIHLLCWEANNIKVGNDIDKYNRRINLQSMAADRCNRLCALIEIAKGLFHLKSKRAVYWVGLTVNLRAMIRAWHDSDVKRLKPKQG